MLRSFRTGLVLATLSAAGGACSEGDSVRDTGSSGSTDGPGPTSSSSAAGGSGGAGASGGGGAGAAGGVGASGGGGGSGGIAGGGGGGWPTCDTQPANVPTKTLNQIWLDDPAMPTEVWVPGVYVTAVSQGGCQSGQACQIFVQQSEAFSDLAAGSQQALKIFVSAAAATYFVGLAVGDQVDVYANAWRYDIDGQNELLLQVSLQLPGCAKKVGAGMPAPVTVTLTDLSVTAYEDTIGPLLVKVDTVSGNPAMPTETFGLWDTGMFDDGGLANVTSLSPYFLQGGAFVGLLGGQTHEFSSVTGVFGLFTPGPGMKYEEIYVRTMADAPVSQVLP